MKFKKALLIDIKKEHLDDEYWEKLDDLVDEKTLLLKDDPQINKELATCDCLLILFGVTVDKDQINNAPDLKYIGILATAYGKVDTDYAKKKGIIVSSIPGYSSESVAEFVIAAILENLRDLAKAKQQASKGNF